MMSPERDATDIQEVVNATKNVERSMKDIDVTCVVATAVSKDYEVRKTALFRAKQRFL